ncbi:uncharacterized protein CTRU02_200365 [Colletotrichum truncatum]|uniref:Uncharacterized protein n=1 Tax=Colletotrichum truncatum TaxID=5467 RepID=A0ACC3ZEN6_COLTU|nr:uncharacterized protein CTRU02_00122 [Colletotrichum truncatum]KAF6801374.1 hypothetical protein CTRU02_00122 [Colletotrichum truncatum]
MHSLSLLRLPSSLLLLIAAHVNANDLMAIRKMPPSPGEKLLPEDLAFANDVFAPSLTPREQLLAARMADDPLFYNASYPFRPPFAQHGSSASSSWEHFRRAAEALHILESRQACPTNMKSCENIGSPNKCCMSNEVCVKVEDEKVGNVACCPDGASCNAPVGTCPSGSESCAADLGGGCCIPGYICQGVGCVPSPPPAPSTTSTRTTANGGGGAGGGGVTSPVQTIVTTSTTTLADGNTRTVIITVTVTENPGTVTTARTTTTTTTPTTTSGNTGAVPPFRPTSTASGDGNGNPTYTPSFCPTGFYACVARAGGGCCQTGRDCATTSCPPTPSTTIISNGATVVVPVSDVPEPRTTDTCANGWFLCGEEGGPVPGCCPSGYACGTASCTTVSATRTGEIQKHFPNSGPKMTASLALVAISAIFALV